VWDNFSDTTSIKKKRNVLFETLLTPLNSFLNSVGSEVNYLSRKILILPVFKTRCICALVDKTVLVISFRITYKLSAILCSLYKIVM